jgi:hypothetical protein
MAQENKEVWSIMIVHLDRQSSTVVEQNAARNIKHLHSLHSTFSWYDQIKKQYRKMSEFDIRVVEDPTGCLTKAFQGTHYQEDSQCGDLETMNILLDVMNQCLISLYRVPLQKYFLSDFDQFNHGTLRLRFTPISTFGVQVSQSGHNTQIETIIEQLKELQKDEMERMNNSKVCIRWQALEPVNSEIPEILQPIWNETSKLYTQFNTSGYGILTRPSDLIYEPLEALRNANLEEKDPKASVEYEFQALLRMKRNIHYWKSSVQNLMYRIEKFDKSIGPVEVEMEKKRETTLQPNYRAYISRLSKSVHNWFGVQGWGGSSGDIWNNTIHENENFARPMLLSLIFYYHFHFTQLWRCYAANAGNEPVCRHIDAHKLQRWVKVLLLDDNGDENPIENEYVDAFELYRVGCQCLSYIRHNDKQSKLQSGVEELVLREWKLTTSSRFAVPTPHYSEYSFELRKPFSQTVLKPIWPIPEESIESQMNKFIKHMQANVSVAIFE